MKKALKAICWIHTGPFPYYIGVCCHEPSFRRKMEKLGIEPPEFIAENSNAMTHYGRSEKDSAFAIITIRTPSKAGVSPEQYAALVAHEAVHVVQHMKETLSPNHDFGAEPEAYLVQMIVSEALNFLNDTGMTNTYSPS